MSAGSRVLLLSALGFGSFAAVQLALSLVAHSLAITTDALVTLVDAMTFLANYAAERRKEQRERGGSGGSGHKGSKEDVLDLFVTEVYVPLLSAASLAIVVMAVTFFAIGVLRLRDAPSDVNLGLVLALALANLALDVVFLAGAPKDGADANVNVYSAWTHLMADTLRSVAVLVAVLVSWAHPRVSSNDADSVAALAGNLGVAVLLVPLLRAVFNKHRELSLRLRDYDADPEERESLLSLI